MADIVVKRSTSFVLRRDGAAIVARRTAPETIRIGTVSMASRPPAIYALAATLLATTPRAGTLAYAEDTETLYLRVAASWRVVSEP
jgi:hypothetical protein